MSVPELFYRVIETFKKNIDKRNKTNYLPKGVISNYPKSLLHVPGEFEFVNTSTYSIFGNILRYDDSINWHRDLINETDFPLVFSFSIDTRSGRNGNVKVVWEVNRLQFLTDICLKYSQTKDSGYLNQFISIINSWKQANPYLIGVNWYSNIEVNIRIINWFVCWELLEVNVLLETNAEFKKFVEESWLPLIELHGFHAFRYESKYSSSNNHLIAEASGLFIAGSYWSFENSPRWIKKGKKILEREIIKQHSKNGINKEEASEYIQFITDFFLIAFLVGERTGNEFSLNYKETLKKIFSYILHLMDISGHVPYYGDDDDGKVLSFFGNETQNNFQSLLTSASILFDKSHFKTKGKVFDLKNRVLFGQQGETKFNNLPVKNVEFESKLYEEGGHFLIKKRDDQKEIYLHVDVAPLGYLSIAAHGHADALSFFLHVDGRPYIVDPGTFTYHTQPMWRAYFKGTLAHNTLRVDGMDQATIGGPSLWLDNYEVSKLEVIDDEIMIKIKGSHNGYNKLGVKHLRSYTFDKMNDIIKIDDEILVNDNRPHVYELPLHLHPEIDCKQLSQNEFSISHTGKRKVTIVLDDQLNSTLVSGSKDPLLGWYSPSFLQKQPTSVIYCKMETTGSFSLKTEIRIR
ncbi:MAG: alginate lyase family protein [Maribacter sp.]|nr:alginate lyase family protein [Maribacter sp.]